VGCPDEFVPSHNWVRDGDYGEVGPGWRCTESNLPKVKGQTHRPVEASQAMDSATRLGRLGLGSFQNNRAAIRYMPIMGVMAQ